MTKDMLARRGTAASVAFVIASAVLLSLGLSGCIVAGYSSSGGAFIWPGGLGLVLLLLLAFFFLRGRR